MITTDCSFDRIHYEFARLRLPKDPEQLDGLVALAMQMDLREPLYRALKKDNKYSLDRLSQAVLIREPVPAQICARLDSRYPEKIYVSLTDDDFNKKVYTSEEFVQNAQAHPLVLSCISVRFGQTQDRESLELLMRTPEVLDPHFLRIMESNSRKIFSTNYNATGLKSLMTDVLAMLLDEPVKDAEVLLNAASYVPQPHWIKVEKYLPSIRTLLREPHQD